MHSLGCVQLFGCISTTGEIAFSPVTPLLTPRHPARDYLANLTLKRAHTRPYQLLRIFRKSSLKRRELRSSPTRLRGVFPLGLPECIRQTLLPSVRGPDRAPRLRRGCCWLASFSLKILQQCLSSLRKIVYSECPARIGDLALFFSVDKNSSALRDTLSAVRIT